MSYKISAGLKENDLGSWISKAGNKYGRFGDGRVDYSNASTAPVVMCTIVYRGKILLVKRGYGLADAEGYWSIVNGFIDEIRPVKEIAKQEVKEELGLDIGIDDIKVAESYALQNPKEKRQYIIFACLVTLKSKPCIVLDRENTDYAWVSRKELINYETLDDLPFAIDTALSLN